MTWLFVVGLALAAFLGLVLVLRTPRAGWEALVAALLLGLAGYAAQGSPNQPAAPRAPDDALQGEGAEMVTERRVLDGEDKVAGDPLLMVADAYVRHDNYADAVDMLRGTVAKDQGNGEAWLALANALVAQAHGMLSPAALYAYRQAAAADPQAPGVPYFLGLALAGSGQFDKTRMLWMAVLARAPADAPWRGDVAARLDRLNQLIAMQQMQVPGRGR